MELLKKIGLILFFVASFDAFAQDSKALHLAFEKSLALETQYQYDAAIKLIKEQYSEKSYPINMRLAWLCYLDKKYASSISYYKKSVELMPAATEPLWALLAPQIALEKWTDVEKTYLKIVKLDPKNSTAHYKLGMIYYYRKEYTKAKKRFDVSLNLFPLDYNSMLMSAWTNYFLGNVNEAKIIFKRIMLLYPGDAAALEGLSLIK